MSSLLSVCVSVYYDFVLHSGEEIRQEYHTSLFVFFLENLMLRSSKNFIVVVQVCFQ